MYGMFFFKKLTSQKQIYSLRYFMIYNFGRVITIGQCDKTGFRHFLYKS